MFSGNAFGHVGVTCLSPLRFFRSVPTSRAGYFWEGDSLKPIMLIKQVVFQKISMKISEPAHIFHFPSRTSRTTASISTCSSNRSASVSYGSAQSEAIGSNASPFFPCRYESNAFAAEGFRKSPCM